MECSDGIRMHVEQWLEIKCNQYCEVHINIINTSVKWLWAEHEMWVNRMPTIFTQNLCVLALPTTVNTRFG